MAASSASLAQVSSSATMESTLQSLSVILEASTISSNDKQKITALVQAHQESEEDDSELGAPAAANYQKVSVIVSDPR